MDKTIGCWLSVFFLVLRKKVNLTFDITDLILVKGFKSVSYMKSVGLFVDFCWTFLKYDLMWSLIVQRKITFTVILFTTNKSLIKTNNFKCDKMTFL